MTATRHLLWMPLAIEVTAPELCMIYGHKWPAPSVWCRCALKTDVQKYGIFLLILPELKVMKLYWGDIVKQRTQTNLNAWYGLRALEQLSWCHIFGKNLEAKMAFPLNLEFKTCNHQQNTSFQWFIQFVVAMYQSHFTAFESIYLEFLPNLLFQS